jgi:hypothetical protein
MHGGYFGGWSDKTWEYNGTDWAEKASGAVTKPPALIQHGMAFDSSRNVTVLLGGDLGGGSGNSSATWEWNGTVWEVKAPITVPTKRRLFAMAYDAARNEVVINGGYEPGVLGDTLIANAAYSYFNLASGTVGSKSANVISSSIVPRANGTYQLGTTVLGTAATHNIRLMSADANLDNVVTGDASTTNTWGWGTQVELSSNFSSYIPTTTTSATRNSDVLTNDPFKYEDYVRQGSETMSFNFDQDPTISSIDSNAAADYGAGTFTWTASGTRVKETTERYGSHWKFNGTDTQLTVADSASWTPIAGDNFSIVAAVVPDALPGTDGHILSKHNTIDNRSWALYLKNEGSATFEASSNGVDVATATKSTTAWAATKPVFLVATYQYVGAANSVGKLYVNDQVVVTNSAFPGPPENNGEPIYIGRSTNGSRFQGKMLFVNWYKGTLLDDATIAKMYDQFKQKYLFSPQMGDANEETKLRINFDYKSNETSASAAGDSIVEISGNYGASDTDSNRIACQAVTTTLVCTLWNDTATATARTITKTGLTQNVWHSVNYYVDLTDLANSTMTVDGAAGTPANMTSNYSVNFRDALLRIGHDYTGVAGFANGWVKNVMIKSLP